MSTGAIIAIVVIIALIVVAAVAAMPALRRARMRRQFGPEYDRLAKELGARKADAELSARLRRAEALGIHPLSAEQQASYSDDWTTVQERFVDKPAEAVSSADTLIWDVMRDRGYPTDDRDASIEALSVYHANAHYAYRQVGEVNLESATTEDLRQALIRCRALFEDLLGAPEGTLHQGELTTRKGASTAGTAR
ncbi:MAG TPA: hypothetical protein VIX15_03330 [Streptosporangiaceae bacterium]